MKHLKTLLFAAASVLASACSQPALQPVSVSMGLNPSSGGEDR